MILLFSFIEKVNVKLKVPGKKLEHHGIKIEFVGQIGMQRLCVCYFVTLMQHCVIFLIEAAVCSMALCHSGFINLMKVLEGFKSGMRFINLHSFGMSFGPEQK